MPYDGRLRSPPTFITLAKNNIHVNLIIRISGLLALFLLSNGVIAFDANGRMALASDNGVHSAFVNDPVVLKQMPHRPSPNEKMPYVFWHENKPFAHIHGQNPERPDMRHQHSPMNYYENFNNFIRDPPGIGLNSERRVGREPLGSGQFSPSISAPPEPEITNTVEIDQGVSSLNSANSLSTGFPPFTAISPSTFAVIPSSFSSTGESNEEKRGIGSMWNRFETALRESTYADNNSRVKVHPLPSKEKISVYKEIRTDELKVTDRMKENWRHVISNTLPRPRAVVPIPRSKQRNDEYVASGKPEIPVQQITRDQQPLSSIASLPYSSISAANLNSVDYNAPKIYRNGQDTSRNCGGTFRQDCPRPCNSCPPCAGFNPCGNCCSGRFFGGQCGTDCCTPCGRYSCAPAFDCNNCNQCQCNNNRCTSGRHAQRNLCVLQLAIRCNGGGQHCHKKIRRIRRCSLKNPELIRFRRKLV